MLGAIIGDIVGSRWEFNPTNDYHFELFSDKNGFTDDTICTIAVADAILHDSDDYGKYIHEWCRMYPNPKGAYGGRFSGWVHSNIPQPYGSFGNGSAMRVSAPKPASPPSEYLNGVPEEVYAKSVQVKKSKKARIKHKLGNLIPKASTSKKGSAKYSDPYKLQMLKNHLAKKYEGYEYGLSDW